jgi:hypothetical protein
LIEESGGLRQDQGIEYSAIEEFMKINGGRGGL